MVGHLDMFGQMHEVFVLYLEQAGTGPEGRNAVQVPGRDVIGGNVKEVCVHEAGKKLPLQSFVYLIPLALRSFQGQELDKVQEEAAALVLAEGNLKAPTLPHCGWSCVELVAHSINHEQRLRRKTCHTRRPHGLPKRPWPELSGNLEPLHANSVKKFIIRTSVGATHDDRDFQYHDGISDVE